MKKIRGKPGDLLKNPNNGYKEQEARLKARQKSFKIHTLSRMRVVVLYTELKEMTAQRSPPQYLAQTFPTSHSE